MPKSPELVRAPDYYAARAAEERRLAETASDPKVRAIHRQLAERYESVALAQRNAAAPPQPGFKAATTSGGGSPETA